MSEEITYTISKPEPIKTIEFNLGNKAFGHLRATDDGRLEFEGDAESSAKVFFDYLCSNFQAFHDSAAQSDLAALREELANMEQQLDSAKCYASECLTLQSETQQRLADAERRNAELVELLSRVQPCISTHTNGTKSPLRAEIDAALKPTESGASE